MIKIPYTKHGDFMRVGSGYAAAESITVDYHDIAEVSMYDFHHLNYKDQETAVIRNPRRDGRSFVPFETWYKAWNEEDAPRFYSDPLDCLKGYNKYVTDGKASIPKGLMMKASPRYLTEDTDAALRQMDYVNKGIGSPDSYDAHYLSYKGINLRNPYSSTLQDDYVSCDPFEPVNLPMTKKEKLFAKFSWLKTKLDYEGLKELDIWWESMIYKENENYD